MRIEENNSSLNSHLLLKKQKKIWKSRNKILNLFITTKAMIPPELAAPLLIL